MSSPLQKMWAHPWIRRPLLLALALSVILGACWLILDRLGKAAWNSFEKELAAEGETTDFLKLLPPPVPEAENFCAIPALRNLAVPETDSSAAAAEGQANRARITALKPDWVIMARKMGGIQRGVPIDYATLAQAMRKEGGWPMPAEPGWPVDEVNAGHRRWDPYFAELAAGLDRPRAQWTPSLKERALRRPYVTMSIPQLVPGLQLGKILGLRAAVAGAAGDFPKAIESLRIARRLAMASLDDPLLINGLVARAIEMIAVGAIWEICWGQQGSTENWRELEEFARAYDLRAASLRIYQGEMAAGLDCILYTRDSREDKMLLVLLPGANLLGPSTGLNAAQQAAVMGLNALPPGFFDAVAAEFGSKQMQYLIRPLRDEGWLGMLRGQRALSARLKAPGFDWNVPSRFGRSSLENFAQSVTPSLYLQVLLDQAAIACVLERTRVATGVYPGSLAGLTLADGQPLPLDVCSGQPMHYRLARDARYVLWSEGPNGRDDHALRDTNPSVLIASPDYAGDWVWGFGPGSE